MLTFKHFVQKSELQESNARPKKGYAAGGFNYETQIVRKLQKHGLMVKSAKAGGSSASAADGHINTNNGRHNLEIKKEHSAMMGQLELHHHPEKGWHVSDKSRARYPHTTAHIEKSGFLKDINKQWGKPSGDYDKDLKMGNVYKHVKGTDAIAAHYHHDRETPYMHIGNAGTFHLKKDSAGIGTTKLTGDTQLRARMKYRGTNKKTGKKKYGALVVMSLRGPNKSNLDLENNDHIEGIATKVRRG